ncbi:putative phytanoyl- hydroxylase protein [Daldinia childiae]|uniref:putative phytanoyl- hydroxylase protein n=1 Tax=Daldinia childiae TaxID=326645 RepID=UPI00144804A4|nr:putative phytanoyl- hydroxylase protein [Daldinia childiae]KAF3055114.1 putative phytanoyl- hydroxylase protein [Daldinia childiae]
MPHAANPPLPVPLYVNDGLLEPEQVGSLRHSSPHEPLEDLRQRYKNDGYLFLKNLLPREDVLKAREAYFTLLAPSGVLAPGTPPVEGVFDKEKDKLNFPGMYVRHLNCTLLILFHGNTYLKECFFTSSPNPTFGAGSTDANGRPRGGLFVDLALQAHEEPWYKDEFCKHPTLHSFISKFTGWGDNTLGLTRSLLRNNTPQNKAIGVHYDQIFLRYGEDTSMTAWIPMGDVALDGGGLIYLEGGHTLGQDIEASFYDLAEKTGLSEEETRNAFNKNMMSGGLLADGPKEFSEAHRRKWLAANYEAGDVVLHTPYTIHASTINKDPKNIIRLGTDLRFVDSSRPYDKRWLNVYTFGDGV